MPIHSATNGGHGHFFPRQSQKENKIPHRHAAPSAPWPWINIHDTVDPVQLASELPPVPPLCDHASCGGCWKGYPQSRFPNWTEAQVSRSKIANAIANYGRSADPCVIYRADVLANGIFKNVPSVVATDKDLDGTWNTVIRTIRPKDIRVRALFVKNLSGSVLQMLGTSYNIEPFYFSSSLNWIPSRFQEDIQDGKGDHITVTLTFLKSMPRQPFTQRQRRSRGPFHGSTSTFDRKQLVDTKTPLPLPSTGSQLVLDLLSVHLVRNVEGSTIISFHPETDSPTTSAEYLHERIRFAGQSVYWQKIFQASPDPTFVLLTFIWHAMYAWDEALEDLYSHIGQLETSVISTSNMELTEELHGIRAHQLHYSSLLEDFRKTVNFIRTAKNPAMESFPKPIRLRSAELMKRECSNLMNEIERLDTSRKMVDKQLKNVMNLVFSSVTIEMTDAAVKDSAAMKQIAFVTMIYLPASFVAGIFGMNIQEINPGTKGTVVHYAATAASFTLATIWIIIAFQSRHLFEEGTSLWRRLGWPYLLFRQLNGRNSKRPVRNMNA